MSIICKLIYPDGFVRDCSISHALATRMLLSCTGPSIQCMDNDLVPDWHQASVYIYDDMMYTHEVSHMYCMEMTVCVTYDGYMQVYFLDGLMWDCKISSLTSSYWCARVNIPCHHRFREWMLICWLKCRCLNQCNFCWSILCELYSVNPEW